MFKVYLDWGDFVQALSIAEVSVRELIVKWDRKRKQRTTKITSRNVYLIKIISYIETTYSRLLHFKLYKLTDDQITLNF